VSPELLTFVNPAWPPPANPLLAVFFWVFLTPVAVTLQFFNTVFHAFGPTRFIGSFGLAVILVTLVIRGLLFPLFRYQIRTTRRIQDEQRKVAPELKELRQKYKKDPQKLNQEVMALYRTHGVNPLGQLSGCLTYLPQLPIIYALYGSVHKLGTELHGSLSFLWIPDLNLAPFKAGLLAHPTGLIVPLVSAILTFAQSKMVMQQARPDMSDQELQMYKVSSQMAYLMPVVIFVVALQFQQAVGLYWITQSGVMVLQQYFIIGWGQLRVPSWFPGSNRMAPAVLPSAPRGGASAGRRGGAAPAAKPPAAPPAGGGGGRRRARRRPPGGG